MLVLITYDVNTETTAGKARLRKVAKQCVNYGRRVQNSVFECLLDQAQCIALKAKLTELIDEEVDSLRFYYLGNKYQTKVDHVGVDHGLAADQVLIFIAGLWSRHYRMPDIVLVRNGSRQEISGRFAPEKCTKND